MSSCGIVLAAASEVVDFHVREHAVPLEDPVDLFLDDMTLARRL